MATCHLPPGRRQWGLGSPAAYAVRSKRSWGAGDLQDLARLGRWARSLGAGFIQLNPPRRGPRWVLSNRARISPPAAASCNPTYIAIEKVPGFRAVATQLEPISREARRLNSERLIDHTRVHDLKLAALEAIWATAPPTPGFDAWLRREGPALQTYVTYCAAVTARRRLAKWLQLRRPGPQ